MGKNFRQVTSSSANLESPAALRFRRGRNLLFRFGLGLGCFPPDRRGLRRRLLAIQISEATTTFDSDPMLLTHEAFYRAGGVPVQREISRGLPKPAWPVNPIAMSAPVGYKRPLRTI